MKYTNEQREAILAVTRENRKRGTGAQYLSSKQDSEHFFEKAGALTICDIKPVEGNVEGTDRKWNVVLFSDNHQISATRLFDAKGLNWPVGGDEAKTNYLLDAIEAGKELTLTPKGIITTPMKYRDGKYVCRENGRTVGKEGVKKGNKIEAPEGAVMAVTYEFQPFSFPKL